MQVQGLAIRVVKGGKCTSYGLVTMTSNFFLIRKRAVYRCIMKKMIALLQHEPTGRMHTRLQLQGIIRQKDNLNPYRDNH
jgi:hypothetical protein